MLSNLQVIYNGIGSMINMARNKQLITSNNNFKPSLPHWAVLFYASAAALLITLDNLSFNDFANPANYSALGFGLVGI